MLVVYLQFADSHIKASNLILRYSFTVVLFSVTHLFVCKMHNVFIMYIINFNNLLNYLFIYVLVVCYGIHIVICNAGI